MVRVADVVDTFRPRTNLGTGERVRLTQDREGCYQEDLDFHCDLVVGDGFDMYCKGWFAARVAKVSVGFI